MSKLTQLLILIFCILYLTISDEIWLPRIELIKIFIIIAISVIVLVIILFFISKKFPKRFEAIKNFFFEEEVEEENIYSSIKEEILADKKSEIENKDILQLMLTNMMEIRDFYILSKKQAKKAFLLATFTIIIGIIFIVIAILMLLIYSQPLNVAIIPAIAGVITEFIAATVLVIYSKTLNQLNIYYNSLHNNERYLSIVNLVSKISKDKRDETYMEIIKSELKNINV